jgi:hypothetical protein
MKQIVGLSFVALITGAGCWFFGLDIVPSIVVALAVAVVLFAVQAVHRPIDNYEWPPAPPTLTDGARREVSELDWALRTRRRFVDDPIVERVRKIVISLLRQRHLDPEYPPHRERIERLVGPQVYLLIVSPDRVRMSVPAMISVLARLEALENDQPAARARP